MVLRHGGPVTVPSEEGGPDLFGALAKAQGMMRHAGFDRQNSHTKSRYATLAACLDAVREPLSSCGLSVSQLVGGGGDGHVVVTTVLGHESGQYLSTALRVAVAPGPGQSPIQGVGGAITYARRYALLAIVGMSSAEDDDDGNGTVPARPAPAPAPRPTREQWEAAPHHPSFEADRAGFMARLGEMHLKYESVKDSCYHRGWPKPSAITSARRARLLDVLRAEREEVDRGE